jgi:DNA-binding winged helix-turn-helix (wHTH) protein
MISDIRKEIDSLGEVDVPADKLWGAQTQRSLEHFSIGKDLIPREMIVAYATPKRAAANADRAGKRLDDRADKPEDSGLSEQPLSIVIIISRMDSAVRSPVESREPVLRVGSLELNLIDRTAKRGNRQIDLLPREFQLLKYMMQRSDQLLTRAALIKDVWHYKFVPETNRIDVHMGRLRRKVDGSNDDPMIRNVRGEGFVLTATPALSKNLFGLRRRKQRALTPTNSNNV